VFAVIERTPDPLAEFDGIGKMRQHRITAGRRQQKAIREIMVPVLRLVHLQGLPGRCHADG